MTISNLETLAIGWKIEKDKEDEAKKNRLQIEKDILEVVNGETKFFDLRIGYSENRSWDAAGLSKLAGEKAFPFKTDYREILSESKTLQKMAPEYWDKNFAPLLTIKPSKPAFSWKGK